MTAAQRSDWKNLPIDTPVLIVHQATGTYLQTQSETADTLNSGLQNEHHWPLPKNKTTQWRFKRVPAKGGEACLLLNDSKSHAVTLATNNPAAFVSSSPTMQEINDPEGSLNQLWDITPFSDGEENLWVLSPWEYAKFALSPINSVCANDQWIVPNPNYGVDFTIFHTWSIFSHPHPG